MWITYSYDMGSISDCSEKFDLEVPENLLCSSLTKAHIQELLKSHHAYIDQQTIISYYNVELEAYTKLDDSVTFDPQENEEVELIIKNSKLSEYPSIIDKVEELKNFIYDLEKQGGDQDEEEENFSQIRQEIDIAVLYAAPLVKGDRLKMKSCEGFNINYSREKEHMLKEFKDNAIDTEVRFEVATLKNLRMIMSLNPKIVHISCHGYYIKNLTDFVLAFESSEMVGLTEEVSQNSLRGVLKGYPNFSGIFMISACYSEAIESVLVEAGIKYFVVIHKDCKIHDNAAIDFAVKFYKHLFLGNEISRSFDFAWNHLKKIGSDVQEVCCCVHKHSETCPFAQSENMHLEHTPNPELCHCDRKKNFYRHKIDCKWAESFNEKCNLNRVLTNEEIKEKHWVTCCCPDKKVPHDDYAKFILKKNTTENNFRLYSGFESRDNKEYLSVENLLKPQPIYSEVVGRGKEMYEILRKLSGKNRLLMVHGPRDVGKTAVIRYVAQYGYERKLFKNGVIYVDMKKKCFAKQAMSVIAEKLSCLDLHMDTLVKNLESLQIFIIIDNLDLMNEQEIIELCDKVKHFHEYTKYSKFCIVRRNVIKREMFDEYCLEKFDKKVVGSLIKNFLTEARYRQIRDHLKKICENIDKTPPNVIHYMNLLRDKDIKEILKLVENDKETLTMSENESIQNFITNLTARSPETLKFLKLIGKFPEGVYKKELTKICSSVNLNLESILAVLKTRHNSILDLDSQIFSIPSKVISCSLLSGVEAPDFDSGIYLRNLAESLYYKCLQISPNSKILQSHTILFFTHDSCKISESPYFPETSDDAFTVFEEMAKNFSEFIKFRESTNSKYDTGQNIYEICIFVSRIWLLKKNRNEVESIINETISHLRHLKQSDINKHSELVKRLKLFKVSVLYEHLENNIEGLKNLETLIEFIKQWFELGQNPNQSVKGEIYLLKSLISIKKKNNENVKNWFEKAVSYFESPEFEVEKARTYLAMVNWLLEHDPNNDSILDYLHYSKEVFTKIKALRLFEEVNFDLGRHYFQKESWLKCENYWNEGLKLASELEDRNLEIKYKEKLTQTYAQIRKRSRNVISILRAYPIVCHEAYRDLNDSVFCTHFSNFKDDLVNTLIEDNKIICLKFEIGTRLNLIQQIEQGCRVLHISTAIPHNNKLVLEKEDFSADVFDHNTLASLLEDKLRVHGVELVVLATPYSAELAEFFYSTLLVPNVICFDFKQYPEIKYLTQLQKMFELAVEKFCINFYHHLIEGQIVRDAWSKSKKIVDSFIESNKTLFGHLNNRGTGKGQTYLGKGPVLLGNGNSALFADSTQELLLNDTNLKIGKLINMSSLKPPTNIPRKMNSFVGRHKLMYEIVTSLKNDGIVHIVGEQGIGKTKLIQHIGVYLNGRGLYGLGTYYESLKGSCNLDKFKDIANLNEDQNGGKKDLLLIIDDCEQILRELPTSFISLIDKLHGIYGVHVIMASLPCNFLYKCKQIEIKPLDPLESAGLFMAAFDRNLLVSEVNSYNYNLNIAQNLTQSHLIKDCMNNPSKVLKLVEKLKVQSFNDLELERSRNHPLMKKKSSEMDIPDIEYSYSSYEDREQESEVVGKEVIKTPKPKSKGHALSKEPEPGKKKRRK